MLLHVWWLYVTVRWLQPANRQRLFNRGTGLLFIGFGGALLGARA